MKKYSENIVFEVERPPESREEAKVRQVRPPPDRYQPEKLSHWSVTMTVAWIVWGEIDDVRLQWDRYRQDCADWVYEDVEATGENKSQQSLGIGEVSQADPDGDIGHEQRAWRFRWWKPAGWNQLYWCVYVDDVPPEQPIEQLFIAAGEGKITATAIDSISGDLVEIPTYHWARLRCADDQTGAAVLKGAGRTYRDIQFPRLAVVEVWPKTTKPEAPTGIQLGDANSGPTPQATEALAVRRLPQSQIKPEFARWRGEQQNGYVPTEAEDIEHMKKFGVSRDVVRTLRREVPRRKRGEKTGTATTQIRG